MDGGDLAMLQPNIGQAGTWEDGDLDADGFVTPADLDLLESMFGLALAVAA